MTRQMVTVLLAVTFLFLLFPAVVLAEDYTWSDNGDGTCTITDYTGPGGDVTIPDTLASLIVTSIGNNAFQDCINLTSIIMPDSVTSIGGFAFFDCDNLASVTIPEAVTFIGTYAFCNCASLTDIFIPENVTSIEDHVFTGCTNLTAITVDSNNSAFSSIDGVVFSKDQTVIVKHPQGKAGDYTIPGSVTSIGNGAFYGCSSLTSVTIPDSVTSIGDYAFSRCVTMTSVIIPDSVTSIGYRAFWNCDGLTSVIIGDSVTSIGDEAFSRCDALTSVTIGSSVTSIGNKAFFRCVTLTSVIIPDSVTSIGDRAFEDCTGLTSVTIGNGVTSIGSSVFNTCTGLTSVTIGNSVTSIGGYAFWNCSSLISVIIPDSVTYIGDNAFSDCSGLTSIYFKGDPPGLGSSVFSGVNAIVYYLPGTTGWDVTYGGLPTEPWPLLPADVYIDIKPGSCPNPVNVKSKGVLPVAILGTEEFDVGMIDVASIFLNGVPAIRSSYEDVAGPVADPNECECATEAGDGFDDLVLKFYTQQIVEALGQVDTGDILTLPLTGVLNDGTCIEGADCVVIVGRHKPINEADINEDGVVNTVDIAIVAENWLESSIVEE